MQPHVFESIRRILSLILDASKIEYTIDIEQESNQFRVVIHTPQELFFTSQHNAYIYALQHIVRTLVHKEHPHDKTHFLLDVNHVRKLKEQRVLDHIPPRAIQHVAAEGSSLIILHLSSYERLLLRNHLSDTNTIELMSVGHDDERKLLILPTSHIGAKGLDNAIIIDSEELS